MKVSVAELIGKNTEDVKKNSINKVGKNVIKKNYKDRLIDRARKHNSYKKVLINSNCDSCRVKNLKFNNHLKNLSTHNKYCVAVKDIFSFHGKKVNNEELPIRLDEERLNVYKRHKKILTKIGYDNEFINGVIHKSPYLDKVSRLCESTAHKGQDIRVYYKYHIESNLIEIILLDLYHLFATSKLERYSEVSGYNIKISKILYNM